MAAPTYFGSASNPADNGTGAEPVTLPVTPPVSMVAGDLVLLIGQMQVTTAGQITLSAQGGQSWSAASVVTGANDQVMALFWCQFDGTWDTNPSLAFAAAGGTQPCTAFMHVFRPATVGTWAVDTAIAGGAEASASPVVISGITPVNQGNVVLAGWMIPNVSTWGTLAGTGWVVTGTAQYRNTSGSDQSASFAHQLQDAAAFTNDVSKVPSTAAAGISWTMAWSTFTKATKTQTGVSRIQKTTTKTQPGVSRIQATTTKTQTGLSRIQIRSTKTQPGTARLQITTTKTQTGKSAIQKTTTKTQTGVANISAAATTTTKTQPGISRIQIITIKTQTGVSRIQAIAIKTQTGIARVQNTTTKTQTGVARIIFTTTTKTQTGVANIIGGVVFSEKYIPSIANTPKTLPGVSTQT